MWGNRGYYQDGEEIVTLHQRGTAFSAYQWQLYNLADDPTETRDLAGRQAGRAAQLVRAWDRAAWENQVYPLDERVGHGLRLGEADVVEPRVGVGVPPGGGVTVADEVEPAHQSDGSKPSRSGSGAGVRRMNHSVPKA